MFVSVTRQRWLRLSNLVVAGVAAAASLSAVSANAVGNSGVNDYPDSAAICQTAGYPNGSSCPGYNWGYWNSGHTSFSVNSSRGFGYRNCTDFVAYRLGLTWSSFGFPANKGNAIDWRDYAANAGLTVTSTPHVGDVAWWNTGTYGHVAVVISVNSSNNTVGVEDYNFAGTGAYDNTRTGLTATAYLHRPTNAPTVVSPTHTFGKVDFNADGISDYVIFSGGTWTVKSGASPNPYLVQGVQLGDATSIPFLADFNGDGITDFITYTNGIWAVRSGASPNTFLAQGVALGGGSSVPAIGDFNHDGVPDFVIDAGGQWAVKSGVDPNPYLAQGVALGGTSSTPVVADFNGDGVSDYGVYDNGIWTVKSGTSPNPYISQGVQLGGSNYIPVVGDLNHDGIADYIVEDGGQWAVKSGASPYGYLAQGVSLGSATTTPFLANLNLDSAGDYVVYDNGTWTVKSGANSTVYIAQGVQLGGSGSVGLTG